MRVFGFVRQKSAAKFIMADLMDAFRRLGWDYAWLDMEAWKRETVAFPPKRRREAMGALLLRIKDFSPDIIISYGLEAFHPVFADIVEGEEKPFFEFFPEAPFVCFFFDFGSPFTDARTAESIPFIRQMQGRQFLFLCWDKDAIAVMRSLGIAKTLFFPLGVNEATFKRVPLQSTDREKYGSDFCFIGGPTSMRIRLLEAIHDRHLKIFGYGRNQWLSRPLLKTHYQYPVLGRDELVKIYNASLSSINITREHGTSSLNMRVYEAMGCGSVLLTDDKADARTLFVPDRELLIYQDGKELRETAQWIVKNRVSAQGIARRARERILGEYTYLHRIRDIMPMVEQFVCEFSALNDLGEKIGRGLHPEILRDIDAMMTGSTPSLNADLLHLMKAHIFFAKGQIRSAKACIDRSLAVNPRFIRALKTRRQFDARNALP